MNLVGDTVESAGAQYVAAGYTLAVLYYRLPRSATDASWRVCSDPWEAVEGVAAALRLLRENTAEYRVDARRIVLSGFSAGGHLGALYSSICEERHACPRAQVLHFPFLERGAKIFCSAVGAPFDGLEEYDACFPTRLVDMATPPTVLYHAIEDTIVPQQQMSDFAASLEGQGASFEYFKVDGGGHYLVPFSQVVAASDGVLDGGGSYASLVERALGLPIPACVRCDDVPTTRMADNGKTCDGSEWHIHRKCADDPSWVASGYCRLSCFEAGRGYPGETCCRPRSAADCMECSDDPTPWMVSNGKTCENSPGAIQSKCNDDSWWVANNSCQQTCFDAERGYNGIKCCKLSE